MKHSYIEPISLPPFFAGPLGVVVKFSHLIAIATLCSSTLAHAEDWVDTGDGGGYLVRRTINGYGSAFASVGGGVVPFARSKAASTSPRWSTTNANARSDAVLQYTERFVIGDYEPFMGAVEFAFDYKLQVKVGLDERLWDESAFNLPDASATAGVRLFANGQRELSREAYIDSEELWADRYTDGLGYGYEAFTEFKTLRKTESLRITVPVLPVSEVVAIPPYCSDDSCYEYIWYVDFVTILDSDASANAYDINDPGPWPEDAIGLTYDEFCDPDRLGPSGDTSGWCYSYGPERDEVWRASFAEAYSDPALTLTDTRVNLDLVDYTRSEIPEIYLASVVPVPEPQTYGLFLLGIAFIGAMTWRRTLGCP